MKLLRQSGSEDGSDSKGVNPFFSGPGEESSVILRRVRETLGYIDCRLDELSGVYRPYLHRIENGIKANLRNRTVVKISAGFQRLGVGVLTGHRAFSGRWRPTDLLVRQSPVVASGKKTYTR